MQTLKGEGSKTSPKFLVARYWGGLLDQFLNRQIDFRININNVQSLLAIPLPSLQAIA